MGWYKPPEVVCSERRAGLVPFTGGDPNRSTSQEVSSPSLHLDTTEVWERSPYSVKRASQFATQRLVSTQEMVMYEVVMRSVPLLQYSTVYSFQVAYD